MLIEEKNPFQNLIEKMSKQTRKIVIKKEINADNVVSEWASNKFDLNELSNKGPKIVFKQEKESKNQFNESFYSRNDSQKLTSNYNGGKQFGYNSVEVGPSSSKTKNLGYQLNQFDTKGPLYLKFIQSLDKSSSLKQQSPLINIQQQPSLTGVNLVREDRDPKIRTAYSKVFLPEMIRKAAANNLNLVSQHDKDINTVIEFNNSREKNEGARRSLNKIVKNNASK